MAEKPNILLFVVDEMRADHMGCAGNRIIRTPNLDALARDGVRFSRAYCNNPICMPARASMFTGRLPRDHGVYSNNMEMHPGLPLLPALLGQAGYRTHSVGKLHLSRWVPAPELEDPVRFPESAAAWGYDLAGPCRHPSLEHFPTPYYGFQSVDFVGGHGSYAYGDYFRWLEKQTAEARARLGLKGALDVPKPAWDCYGMGLDAELHYNRWIADRTIRFLESTSSSGQPFFVWCSFPDPHAPFTAPAPYCTLYDPAAMPLPRRRPGELEELPPYYQQVYEGRIRANGHSASPLTDAAWRAMLAMTYGMISFVDDEIGRVLAAVESLGLRRNTIIGFISDHGDMLGDHWMIYKGPFMFESCTRIPLVLAAPGGPRGCTYDGLACQIDLVPTLLSACGVPPPEAGRLLREGPNVPDLGTVAPLRLWPGEDLMPVLTGRTAPHRESVVIQNDEPFVGLKIRTLVTDRFKLTVYPGHDFGEFFDLESDPDELHNLWSKPEWMARRRELERHLFHEDARLSSWHPLPFRTA